MKKNRLLAALLAGLLLLSLLAGCGGNNNTTTGNQPDTGNSEQADSEAGDTGELEGDIALVGQETTLPEGFVVKAGEQVDTDEIARREAETHE